MGLSNIEGLHTNLDLPAEKVCVTAAILLKDQWDDKMM